MEDILYSAARKYMELLDYQYNIVLGYKGKSTALNIRFEKVGFTHLSGLHKLKDLELPLNKGEILFNNIIDRKITFENISKSIYFHNIKDRLADLANIEYYIDNSISFFDWNKKMAAKNHINSAINADYLIKNNTLYNNSSSYIFLAVDNIHISEQHIYVNLVPTRIEKTIPSSFFNDTKDYAGLQKKYTLLYKEKITNDNKREILYKHHNFSLDAEAKKDEKVQKKATSVKRNNKNLTKTSKDVIYQPPEITSLDGFEFISAEEIAAASERDINATDKKQIKSIKNITHLFGEKKNKDNNSEVNKSTQTQSDTMRQEQTQKENKRSSYSSFPTVNRPSGNKDAKSKERKKDNPSL